MKTLKIVIATAVALSFAGLDAAAAAGKKRHHKARATAPIGYVPNATASPRTPGPSWAGPNDCYTDEGYGRYLRCGGGMDM